MTWSNDLQTRFCQYIGIQLDRPHWKTTGAASTLGCHWNHTGRCQHQVVLQWRSSVNLHYWNTLEDHWSHKYTGMPLELHWLVLAPVVSQWRSSVNLHNWNTLEHHWEATGRPLEHTGNALAANSSFSPVAFQCTLGSKFQAHWIATGLSLNYHWLRVRVAFVQGLHQWPANSPHKWPVKRKMFPFDDVIMSEHWLCVGWWLFPYTFCQHKIMFSE